MSDDTLLILGQISRFLNEDIERRRPLPTEPELANRIETWNENPGHERVAWPGPMKDAWGTRIRYEILGDGATYRLTSAGADRKFESGSVPPLGERYDRLVTGSLAADLVYERSKESGFDGMTRKPAEKLGLPLEARAMLDVRSVSTACEAYHVNNGKYPDASSIEALSPLVVPLYIREIPLDPWGTPLGYRVSGDGRSYRVSSAGPDRTHSPSNLLLVGTGKPPLGDDVVLENGAFVLPK